jgi:hypothetical protein
LPRIAATSEAAAPVAIRESPATLDPSANARRCHSGLKISGKRRLLALFACNVPTVRVL